MTQRVLFIMGLHSHQPVGNFDFVFEKATSECYHPFLEVLGRYPGIRMSLHYSGVLLEWIRQHHPETFDLLVRLVESGQVEMMGGGFDEPILVMIPDRDKLGQIRKQSDYLRKHFGVKPEGLWLAERVWEQCLVKPIVDSGLSYVAVDDSHFKFAGLGGSDLAGYYTTEDRGRVLSVFPMDELLRYYVPFQDPEKTVEYLRGFAREDGKALVTYADDGEKFGSWPGTHKHIYLDGWLERFFDLLTRNTDWIEFVTFAEALRRVEPLGQVFLPDASYREMMEWVLPVDSQQAYEDLVKDFKERGVWEQAKFFVKGGFWRGFRAKYPEANEMYAKMMLVSEKVARLAESNGRYEAARDELYQGQCNCSYWHGVFGGLYLPHLRYAIYRHLIAAENIADEGLKGKKTWCESQVVDYNFDRRPEVLLSSPQLSLYVVPHRGGHLAELDIRKHQFNPLAVLTRRPEAYHRTVLRKHDQKDASDAGTASIHDSVTFKSEGLEKMLQYDPYKREGLVDHVLSAEVTLDDFARADFPELGDFVEGDYTFEVSKRRNLVRLTMKREGRLSLENGPVPLVVRKEITLGADRPVFSVDYELTGPADRPVHFLFGVETCYAMLAAHADDRFYYRETPDVNLGQLATRVDVEDVTRFGIIDGWQSLDIALSFSVPAHIWTFPLETVSQSEAGFESVYQGSVVLARWPVELKPGETWKLKLEETHDSRSP
ncbi:MAG TPA: alpha-amylase/4-alpha-glucanotransferase domain-containing protein [Planctomycetota bacterium]|nr:alpha-amylase/4-alpha-glucanotransferase domain-containing protein [Planctomycetota bacterium]